MPIERASKIHAWVSVMYGCNNYCTYCIVPYVRGRERSRRSDEIITEVKSLIANGCKDITLLGQNVNSYSDNCTFPQLLDKISSLDGEFRLRFMTSHPKDASHELVDIMSKNNKIARHFHLPVQSGSDRILKLMNRSYTREQYIEKALYIKQKMPDISLTSDIICGFPGETDEDFEQTVSLIEQLQLDMIYAFIYSPRVGTLAEKMENQISHSKKVERFEYLSKIQNDIALKINETYIGKTIEILSDESKSGIFTGRTTQNKIVSLDKFIEPGKFAYAKIISAHPYSLDGVLV
ncbi:MAG: MiaB/RimO family radical SAM methylthiotransferase [Clostridia bacterium]